jgi:hypothetical protein
LDATIPPSSKNCACPFISVRTWSVDHRGDTKRQRQACREMQSAPIASTYKRVGGEAAAEVLPCGALRPHAVPQSVTGDGEEVTFRGEDGRARVDVGTWALGELPAEERPVLFRRERVGRRGPRGERVG